MGELVSLKLGLQFLEQNMHQKPISNKPLENDRSNLKEKTWPFIHWIFILFSVVVATLFACLALILLCGDDREITGIQRQVLMGMGAISIPLLASILLKEGKISEFRQSWIDGLRENIAEFYANAKALKSLSFDYSKESKTERLKILEAEASTILINLDKQKGLIELRLNPDDASCKRLKETLGKFKDANDKIGAALRATDEALNAQNNLVTPGYIKSALASSMPKYMKTYDEYTVLVNLLDRELIERAQGALKNEWVRVKRGEPIFRATWVILLGVIFGSILFLSKRACILGALTLLDKHFFIPQ